MPYRIDFWLVKFPFTYQVGTRNVQSYFVIRSLTDAYFVLNLYEYIKKIYRNILSFSVLESLFVFFTFI